MRSDRTSGRSGNYGLAGTDEIRQCPITSIAKRIRANGSAQSRYRLGHPSYRPSLSYRAKDFGD